MKTLVFSIVVSILCVSAGAQISSKIDPQRSEVEKEELFKLQSVTDKIIEGEAIVSDRGEIFRHTSIVTFAKELPSEAAYAPETHEAVQHVFMFLSEAGRWLCEFRIHMIWEHNPDKVILQDTVTEPGDFLCYPRI